MKLINQQTEFDEVLANVVRHDRVAIDTEADSLHSYFDKTCLVQISTPDIDAVVDPLSKISLTKFGEILANPAIQKVLHGADYDLRILDRDFKFHITSLFDTMVASQLLGYEGVGLAALLKRHFEVELDKSHQRADWARRPLPDSMLKYATLDTRYLLRLSDILRAELEALGRWEWAKEEFERLELIRFREPEEDLEAFRKLKGIQKMEPRQLAALARLHRWRDGRARKRDVPPFRIIRNESMIEIACLLPTDVEALKRIKGIDPRMLERAAPEIVLLMEEALALDEDALPQQTETKKWNRDKELERRIDSLKSARDAVAAELKIDTSILAPKHLLTAIATRKARTEDELKEVPLLRRWQREVLQPRFLEIAAKWV